MDSMTKNKHKQIEVVAAIIRKDDKIFATQRGYGETGGSFLEVRWKMVNRLRKHS